MNKEIEMLNKKIEAQDKIINEQVLEIARLKEQLEILLEDNNQLEEIRIKAIELIKLNICGGSISNAKELLAILGEKE